VGKRKHTKKTAKNNIGKLGESELNKSMKKVWRKYPHFFKRISDTNTYAINFCPNCKKTFNTGYIGQKELADFELVFEGGIYYIEVKTSKNKTSFPIRNIKEHQRYAYKSLKPYGAEHYFFIMNRYQRGNFKLYIIESEKFDNLISKIEVRRKSIPWGHIIKEADLTIEREHSLWLVEPFFEYLKSQRQDKISNIIKNWEDSNKKLTPKSRKELIKSFVGYSA